MRIVKSTYSLLLLLLLTAFTALQTTPALSATLAGKACSKVGATTTSSAEIGRAHV